MPKPTINSETLKQYRDHARLSQQGLADVSKVSKKTIARIEGGKSSANNTTVSRLSKALGVSPEALSKPFSLNEQEENRYLGYQTSKVTIDGNAELAYQMVERCYGVSREDQLTMAPLFTALLAEGSLAWRRHALEEAEGAVNKLKETFNSRERLPDKEIMDLERALLVERESIEQRDFFGKQVIIESPKDTSPIRPDDIVCNPFRQYLAHLQLDTELIEFTNGFMSDRFSVGYYWVINSRELHRLTGSDPRNNDPEPSIWARRALQWGHVKVTDIPPDLMDDGASDKRIAWLADKVPQDERDDYKAWEKDIDDKSRMEYIDTLEAAGAFESHDTSKVNAMETKESE